MAQPTQAKAQTRTEKEAQQKALRRAEQANILAGVRPILEENEQLLSFARARVAGGWKGKLNVGPEAFFAPYVNVALTERRFLVQHIHPASGKPSQMLPHAYTLDKIAQVTFTDIETFGGEPACRLILHLENGLFVRLRLRGQLNFASARSMGELFNSLTTAKRKAPLSPTKALCPHCDRILDQPFKFCPYCGTSQPPRTPAEAQAEAAAAEHTGITLAVPDETPLTEATVFVTPTSALTNVEENGEATGADIATPAMTISRETDFAYEREDRPAEFGFALPVPDTTEDAPAEAADLEGVSETAADHEVPLEGVDGENVGTYSAMTIRSEGDPLPSGNGAQIAANEDTDNDFDSDLDTLGDDDLFTSGAAAAPLPGEPQANPASTDSGDADTMFSPDEPVQAHDAVEPGGVAFEQYEAQPFTELPFSDTLDAQAGASRGVDTQAETGEAAIVRDDETEAFLPPTLADADAGSDAAANQPTDDTNESLDTPSNAEPAPDNVGGHTNESDRKPNENGENPA